MSLIIAARFETFDHAKNAAATLMQNGVASEDMHTFFVNPAGAHGRLAIGGDRAADPDAKGASFGAVGGAAGLAVIGAVLGAMIGFGLGQSFLIVAAGAGLGAYVGSLIGGVARMGRDKTGKSKAEQYESEHYAGRPAGVVLAVRVEPEQQERIANLLRDHGGIEVERAQGRWENGQWRDFDPLVTPDIQEDTRSRDPASPV